MKNNIIVKNFIDKLSANAPLENGYKYPYKPAFVIALFKAYENDKKSLFNKNIFLNNYTDQKQREIIRNYYNLITSNYNLYEILIKQKTKNWLQIGFNQNIFNNIISHLFQMPIYKLKCDFFEIIKIGDKKGIKLNKPNELNNDELFDYILDYSFKKIKECIIGYEDLNNNDVFNYQELMESIKNISSDFSEQKRREFQHIFAKKVKDRDQKCIICCEKHPILLEACHIKPFKECENNIEKYDEDNGITLCRNHHKLFDAGFFTFDQNWKVKILDKLIINDYDLNLKQYEKCYSGISSNKPLFNKNPYLEFHNLMLKNN